MCQGKEQTVFSRQVRRRVFSRATYEERYLEAQTGPPRVPSATRASLVG